MALTTDLMVGKRLDLLGRVQFVSLDVSNFGQATLIFQTNNTDFRGADIFIAYIEVVTSDGLPIPAGVSLVLGAGGSTDFLGGAAVDLGGQASGVLIFNQVTNALSATNQVAPMVLYSAQVPIYVVNASSATTSQLAQFSAFGWSVN